MSRSERLVSLFAMTAWLAVGALMVPPAAGAQEEVAPAPAKPAPAPYTGVKKRIAVAKFDAGGTYAAHFTGWDSGGGGGRLAHRCAALRTANPSSDRLQGGNPGASDPGCPRGDEGHDPGWALGSGLPPDRDAARWWARADA
jgi:hypothetical protein